jgi:NAD(P)-dependent dehydrogenase (short-subunit alcohol dehydrogenase family)
MAKVDLTDKAICISGGSSGIGRATAIACAGAGMDVCIMGRRADRLREVVAEIEAVREGSAGRAGRAIAVVGDVTKADDCRAAIDETVKAFGGIYAVYANAGYGLEEPVHLTSDEQLRAIFETNFFGTMNLIRPAIPRMLRAGEGHVLICSSCIGKMSIPYVGAYCATKAAQGMIGRAMNLELRKRGIHTSTVHPVGTKTEFFDITKGVSSGDGASLDAHAPRWLMQSPQAVARATLKCLRRPRPEVWPAWSVFVRYGMAAAMAFPRSGDWGLDRLVRGWEEREAERQSDATERRSEAEALGTRH